MISALIITKDAYDRVKNLCTLLDPYVDEIVVFHSSAYLSRRFKEFSYENPKIYCSYSPPKGFVEAYYEKGIRLCKHDWILLLDDDEIPNKELLEQVKFTSEYHRPYAGYINRFEPNGSITTVLRLFHKGAVDITGLIHRGIEPKEGYESVKLPKLFYITHNSEHSFDKLERFAKIEAQQYTDIIAYVALKQAKKYRLLKYAYFIVSSLPRVIFAPNKKDQIVYLKYLWKELRK
jgi:hypothetical protein